MMVQFTNKMVQTILQVAHMMMLTKKSSGTVLHMVVIQIGNTIHCVVITLKVPVSYNNALYLTGVPATMVRKHVPSPQKYKMPHRVLHSRDPAAPGIVQCIMICLKVHRLAAQQTRLRIYICALRQRSGVAVTSPVFSLELVAQRHSPRWMYPFVAVQNARAMIAVVAHCVKTGGQVI